MGEPVRADAPGPASSAGRAPELVGARGPGPGPAAAGPEIRAARTSISSPAPRVQYLALAGLSRPVALSGCDPPLLTFRGSARTWPTALSRTPAARPVISIDRRGGSFVLNSPGSSATGATRAVRAQSAVRSSTSRPNSSATTRPISACIAARQRSRGRLVLFPSGTRSGKSTLIARLAAAGHRIFADDLLAVDPATRTGRAFGILPRAAPANTAIHRRGAEPICPRPKRIVGSTAGLLRLERDELAGFGETCPLGAIVLPTGRRADRRRSNRSTVALPCSACCCRTDPRRGQRTFDQVAALAASLPAYRLRYSDSTRPLTCLTRMTLARASGTTGEEAPAGSCSRLPESRSEEGNRSRLRAPSLRPSYAGSTARRFSSRLERRASSDSTPSRPASGRCSRSR